MCCSPRPRAQLDELCFKPKSWKDLITDEPFTRKDVIVIQVERAGLPCLGACTGAGAGAGNRSGSSWAGLRRMRIRRVP
jgi:hypothetical protein